MRSVVTLTRYNLMIKRSIKCGFYRQKNGTLNIENIFYRNCVIKIKSFLDIIVQSALADRKSYHK